MDKIFVTGMAFWGYHGVFEEENKLGQRWYADVTLELDARPAGENDDLDATVNYAEVYEKVKEVIEGDPVKLVETLCERTAENLLSSFKTVEACTVKVIKPDPPIPGHYDSVAVEIRRARS
ncbi:dihydroneopterin aldolase [Alteribacter natronophilus]|uniref:dihydroneopterin aldolase n=1 Tax=Alteribacter natronophilus TaxID=2583810 RepID=UPI00110DCE68|nr:dihydroneopterin aldolase [Alteribacter natronophilus]TMW69932.1 dihydroneopterin aldolase [Alteribacter natronophilus]